MLHGTGRKLWLALGAIVLLGAWRVRTFGPIGYWKLNDTAAPAIDAISATNGTWQGTITPSADVPAALSGANPVVSCGSYQISIANAPSYVQIPRTAALDTVQNASYSISCWFKPTSTPPAAGTNSQYGIVMKAGWNEGLVYLNGGQFVMFHWFGGDINANPIVAPTAISSNSYGNSFAINTWYHLVGLVDQTVTPNEVRMYVNGTLVGSAGTFTATPTFNIYQNESWQIGIGIPGNGGAQYQADGLFDDVRIYDRALTPAEITSLAGGMTVGDPAAPPPAAPVSLTATPTVTPQVDLSWPAVAGAASYNIKRSLTTGTETQYATSATNAYTDTGVVFGTTYFYEVTAVGNCAESPLSPEATATLQPPPPHVKHDGNHNIWHRCGCSSASSTGMGWAFAAAAAALLLALQMRRR